MKLRRRSLPVTVLACLFPLVSQGQSTMEAQPGTSIEVTSGADICADNIVFGGSFSGGGTKCGSALPIELASLSAISADRSARITWQTLSETNCYGFEIGRERVSDATPRIDSVAFVGGSGTSLVPRSYAFVDRNLSPGRYIYRLKQVDLDGSFHTYESAAVEILPGGGPTTYSLDQNFPNPFNPSTTIRYTLAAATNVTLSLYNMLGERVAELVRSTQEAGEHRVTFDGSALASGVYFYRLEAPGVELVRKLTLVR